MPALNEDANRDASAANYTAANISTVGFVFSTTLNDPGGGGIRQGATDGGADT